MHDYCVLFRYTWLVRYFTVLHNMIISVTEDGFIPKIPHYFQMLPNKK